jgi:hypothetical protein
VRLQQDLRTLAGRVGDAERRGEPYLLVLGAACAEAASVPSLEQLSREVGASVGAGQRRLIEKLLWSVPVPSFYQDLANLARAGMFPLIFTTGYDNLVERALFDLGLRAGHHFEVIDLAGRPESPERGDGPIGLRIVHGTEVGGRGIEPQALDAALEASRPRGRLDVVLVGYRGEAPTLERWLSAQAPGELWRVSDESQPTVAWRGEVQELTGEDGAPETFFGKLGLLLLGTDAGFDPDVAYESNFEDLTTRGDAQVDYTFAKQRLDRAKAVKGSIERRASSSGADPAAASQLAYQDREIAALEQRLEGLARDAVAELDASEEPS